MIQNQVKYSIIIPVYNSVQYLPTCIDTVINQKFSNYELIISDDNSTDGTTEYLQSIIHPNIKVVHPPHRLSMVEHFEWALSHAKGEWCMFLGGDDGLQHYFFELAEQLTRMADDRNLRAIMSERAYYFWEGCDLLYGKRAVVYDARKQVKTLNCKYHSLLALLGFQDYFELPEMYTTSLVKKELIDETKRILGGHLFTTIPPDANLGAIVCSVEKKYLKSFIPLGWVGTSPLGVKYTIDSVETKNLGKNIEYNVNSANFALRSCSIYFWNAFQRTSVLRSKKLNKFLNCYFFKVFMFAGILLEIKLSSNINAIPRYIFFDELLKINNIKKDIVYICMFNLWFFRKLFVFQKRVKNFAFRFIFPSLRYRKNWGNDLGINLTNISEEIYKEIKSKKMLNIYGKKGE